MIDIAGRVGAGPRQAPIDSSVIDDDMISGRFVGLHPDHRGWRRRGGVDCEEGGANGRSQSAEGFAFHSILLRSGVGPRVPAQQPPTRSQALI